MPDDMVIEGEVEIAPLMQNLNLKLRARIWEDELAEVAARSIVDTGEAYYAKVEWWFEGNTAFTRHFCGKWRLQIHLESIGEGGEYSSECICIPMDPCNRGTCCNPYSHTFELTPEIVEPQECGTVYLLAVTLSTLDVCGDTGHIWGYIEGPSVMFVKGKPHD